MFGLCTKQNSVIAISSARGKDILKKWFQILAELAWGEVHWRIHVDEGKHSLLQHLDVLCTLIPYSQLFMYPMDSCITCTLSAIHLNQRSSWSMMTQFTAPKLFLFSSASKPHLSCTMYIITSILVKRNEHQIIIQWHTTVLAFGLVENPTMISNIANQWEIR